MRSTELLDKEGSLPYAQQPAIYPHPHNLFFTSTLISFSRLRLPNDIFSSDFPTKTLYTFPFSPMRATFPTHLILLDRINYWTSNSVTGPNIDIYSTNQYTSCYYENDIISDAQRKQTTESCLELFDQFTFTPAVWLKIVFNITFFLHVSSPPCTLHPNYGVTAPLMIMVWSVIAGVMTNAKWMTLYRTFRRFYPLSDRQISF